MAVWGIGTGTSPCEGGTVRSSSQRSPLEESKKVEMKVSHCSGFVKGMAWGQETESHSKSFMRRLTQ